MNVYYLLKNHYQWWIQHKSIVNPWNIHYLCTINVLYFNDIKPTTIAFLVYQKSVVFLQTPPGEPARPQPRRRGAWRHALGARVAPAGARRGDTGAAPGRKQGQWTHETWENLGENWVFVCKTEEEIGKTGRNWGNTEIFGCKTDEIRKRYVRFSCTKLRVL